jgi:hypothetical protein
MLIQSIIKLKELARKPLNFDNILINVGQKRSLNYSSADAACLQNAEFQKFFQWAKNRGLRHLVQNLFLTLDALVELGGEAFSAAKCRFPTRRDFGQGMEIVLGQLIRDQALDELRTEPISERQAERDTRFIAKKLGMTPHILKAMFDAPPVPHSAYGSDKAIADRLLAVLAKLRKVFSQ